VGKSYQVLLGATSPADECIKVLKMILKRYHPDDVDRIKKAMQRAELVQLRTCAL
jgi:myo-inositol catabolism protein IolC